MITKIPTILGFLALIIPFATANHWSRRHQEVARRARGDVDIHKRQFYDNARFTYYDVGLGACGQTNQPGDYIVALNVAQYGDGYPGPQCFKQIMIQYGGKTAQATIMDECMGCPNGGLDFSQGLFSYFADTSLGVLYGQWWYVNDGGEPSTSAWTPPSTSWEPPTTTSTPDYTPPATSSTPDYTPPTTSSAPTYTPPPTTTTTTSTSSSSVNLSTGVASGLAVPTGGAVSAPSTGNPQNILVVNDVMVRLGIVISTVEHE